MTHFAEVDETNTVIRIAVLHDDVVTDEQAGIDFLNDLYPESQTWIQTFKDGARYNKAGKGWTWDPDNNAFIAKQPYPSWILNENFRWESPAGPMPRIPLPPVEYEGVTYEGLFVAMKWDEDTTSWVEVTPPDEPV